MAGTTLIIIDASVVLKWFLLEPDTDKALSLREQLKSQYIPIVPSLFYYEISNVLRYKKEFGIKDVLQAIQSLDNFQFKFEPFTGDFAKKTVEIAFIYGITIYDASYVALSEILSADLITADEKLYKKVPDHRIILLSNWKCN
jgi:predicted nucleic acid-binding protein